MMAELVRDDVGLGEVTGCAEALTELVEEPEIQIDVSITRTIEGAARSGRLTAPFRHDGVAEKRSVVRSYRGPRSCCQVDCASAITASRKSTVFSSAGDDATGPDVPTFVVGAAPPPPTRERKSTPVAQLSSSSTQHASDAHRHGAHPARAATKVLDVAAIAGRPLHFPADSFRQEHLQEAVPASAGLLSVCCSE